MQQAKPTANIWLLRMAKNVWTIICRGVSIDSQTNNVTLFEIIDQIKPISVPADGTSALERIDLEINMITLWERGDLDLEEVFDCRLKLMSPTGKELWKNDYTIKLSATKRHRIRVRFPSLPFDGFGVYRFIAQRKSDSGRWTKAGEASLEVNPPDEP